MKLEHRAPAAYYFGSFSTRTLTFTRDTRLTGELDGSRKQYEAHNCPQLETPWWNLLDTVDEREVEPNVRELERALQNAPDRSGCKAMAKIIRERLHDVVREDLPIKSALPPGAEGVLKIEKRDPSTRTVLKTWTVTVTAEGREEGWIFNNEEGWIVGETVRDIASIVLLNKGQPPKTLTVSVSGDPGRPQVTVKLAKRKILCEHSVEFREHVWSPATYVPVAKALLNQRLSSSASPNETPDSSLLFEASRLVDIDVSTLIQENKRLSTILARNPLDASLHEAAALLLAAFALRDAAGSYSDVRRELCGMAAHLALAEATRSAKPISTAGLLADIALHVLAGRDIPALRLLDKSANNAMPDQDKPYFEAWTRALLLRVTGDYRSLKKLESATGIEKYEYLRAIVRTRGSLDGLAFIEEIEPRFSPQWIRPLVEKTPSVRICNIISGTLLGSELTEAAMILELDGSQRLSTELIVESIISAEALRRFDPSRSIEVIDKGLWARHEERHIANAVNITYRCLSTMLGDDDAAMRFRKEAQELTRLPLVSASLILASQYKMISHRRPQKARMWVPREACQHFIQNVKIHPERVQASSWSQLIRSCTDVTTSGEIPLLDPWFSPVIPLGTAYNAEDRLGDPSLSLRYSLQELENLYALTFNRRNTYNNYILRKYGRAPESTDYARDLSEVSEYDIGVLWGWVNAAYGNDKVYLRLLRKSCDLRADLCFSLGEYLVAYDRDNEAQKAYERGVESARDRVTVSTNAEWLMHHYLDRGERKRAVALGKMLADVYSHGGLAAMGHLQERLGEYDKALTYYKSIRKRYQNPFELHSFFIRYQIRHGKGHYRAQTDIALKSLFPYGLTHTTLEDLENDIKEHGNPFSGGVQGFWISTRRNEKFRRFGLQNGDVVLSLDGYRVRNEDQYRCVRGFSDSPNMTAIVWRNGRLIQITGIYKRRFFAPALGTAEREHPSPAANQDSSV